MVLIMSVSMMNNIGTLPSYNLVTQQQEISWSSCVHKRDDCEHSPPNLSVFFIAFCVKVDDALKYKRSEDNVREVRKTTSMCLD